MQTLQVIVILAIFLAGVALMMTKKMPAILALPCMGILIAVVAGVPFISSDAETQSITSYVIAGGASRLASTIIVTVFGAIFAKVIQKEGISDAIIRKAAELPTAVQCAARAALRAAALIFTAMSGAGPVIMVAQIAIPLLLSAGIEPIVAASLVLFGLNIGLLFNVSQYQIYVDTIGMDMEVIKTSSIVMGLICVVVTVAYILINVNKKTVRSTWAMNAGTNSKKVNPVAMLMPLLPIVLVFFFKWNAETSLVVAIIVTALITNPSSSIQVLSSSMVEGIKDVAGVIGLMIGIGILLNGVAAQKTSALMQPIISVILPSNPIMYIVIFTVLSPLALYRGPLNMYGLGSGLANIFLTAGKLSAPAVGMALRSTSVVQCVSDPTNTQNVIVADYAKVDVNDILKSTLPYTMVMALGILIYAAVALF